MLFAKQDGGIDYKQITVLFALVYFFCSFTYQSITYLFRSDFIDFGLNYYNADAIRTNDFKSMDKKQIRFFLQETVDYDSGVLHGRPNLPVARAVSVYPPIVYLALRPFTYLPYRVAALLWFLVNQCLLFGSLGCVLKTLGKNVSFEGKAFLYILTFSFYPALFTIMLGQINFFVLFFLSLSFLFLFQKKELLVGIALGFACATKVIPGLLILFFLWKKRWKVALAASGVFIFAYLISIWLLGLNFHLVQLMMTREDVGEGYMDFANHAVSSFWFMLLTQTGKNEAQGLAHFPKLAYALYILTFLLIFGVSLWATHFSREKNPKIHPVEFALWVALIPLLSPFTTTAFQTVLIFSFWIMLLSLKQSKWVVLVFILSFVLVGLKYWPDGVPFFREGIGVIFLLPKLYGTLLLWGLMVFSLRRWVQKDTDGVFL